MDGQAGAPRRRTAVIAAAVVLVLLVALVGWLVTRGGDDGTVAQPDQSGPAATGQPSNSDAGAGEAGEACSGLAKSSTSLPKAAPEDLTYEVENRAVIPVSDSYGPADRTGPVWTCFSHSPLGAVMAAEVISVRRVASRDRVEVGEEQLVANEGREIYLKAVRATDPDDLTAQPGELTQPAGFRVESYTGDVAVISLVSRSRNGGLQAGSVTVVWEDDTWKLQLLPDGSDTAALTPVTSLDDYIAWGL